MREACEAAATASREAQDTATRAVDDQQRLRKALLDAEIDMQVRPGSTAVRLAEGEAHVSAVFSTAPLLIFVDLALPW